MLQVATLASGSSGNCTLISDGRTHILIDAGISCRRITTGLKELGVDPAQLSAVLVTHEHSDHISGLNTMKNKLEFTLCATGPTARQLCYRMTGLESRLHTFAPGGEFTVGSLHVRSFPTLHDCACPVGYAVTAADGTKMALATDLGVVTEEVERGIEGAQLLLCEANYDPDTLRSGSYPAFLKERILSDHGHLSNEMGGALALWGAERGARTVILGHLSQENNSPRMAYGAVEHALKRGGVRVGSDVKLSVAPRCERSGWVAV